MKASDFLNSLNGMGIDVIAGVPDSTLKQFCDGVQTGGAMFQHYVTANEGAAVGVAVGSYLASGKPVCVYMQNSGIGNTVNPLVSLANREVYGIPVLFVVGWRGEPGVKDEPQHVFQGKITESLFETMTIRHAVIDSATTKEEMDKIFAEAAAVLAANDQYAIIVKKGTFEAEEKFVWENGNSMVREEVLGRLLKVLPRDCCIVSTTGKISRELYEQSNRMFGNHDNIFMTVGGMGHASMIAFGIAKKRPDKRIVCIDGDGAALMHMGALPFIASEAPENFVHIVINNQAHESVGAMPTGCRQADFTAIAAAAGYRAAGKIASYEEMERIGRAAEEGSGPVFFEIPVNLDSRADLSRPKETARENKEAFMSWLAEN